MALRALATLGTTTRRAATKGATTRVSPRAAAKLVTLLPGPTSGSPGGTFRAASLLAVSFTAGARVAQLLALRGRFEGATRTKRAAFSGSRRTLATRRALAGTLDGEAAAPTPRCRGGRRAKGGGSTGRVLASPPALARLKRALGASCVKSTRGLTRPPPIELHAAGPTGFGAAADGPKAQAPAAAAAPRRVHKPGRSKPVATGHFFDPAVKPRPARADGAAPGKGLAVSSFRAPASASKRRGGEGPVALTASVSLNGAFSIRWGATRSPPATPRLGPELLDKL